LTIPDHRYYSSKKWQSLIKDPLTEENLKKQDKIAEDFRNKTGIYNAI